MPRFAHDAVGHRKPGREQRRSDSDRPATDAADLNRFAGLERHSVVEWFESADFRRRPFLVFQREQIFHSRVEYPRQPQRDGRIRHVSAGLYGIYGLARHSHLVGEIDGGNSTGFTHPGKPVDHMTTIDYKVVWK